jgi:hypothetical protein
MSTKNRRQRRRFDGPRTLSVLADICRILGAVFEVVYTLFRDHLI